MNTSFLDPIRKLYHKLFGGSKFKDSGSYWKERYKSGGNSGWGSYNNLAIFKAKVINDFVSENKITTAIEYGCGDGNQCSLFRLEKYIGTDISQVIIDQNKERFKSDPSKEFYLDGNEKPEDHSNIQLSFSLDVIYHLVEDDVFEEYIDKLFNYEYVIIYSSNFNEQTQPHVRHRKFTYWIEQNRSQWKLVKHIKNQFPYDPEKPEGETSKADFFIYHNAQMSRSDNS